jgi:hypothetical protein
MWLTHLRDRERVSDQVTEVEPTSSQSILRARVADEVEVLRWCTDWRP